MVGTSNKMTFDSNRTHNIRVRSHFRFTRAASNPMQACSESVAWDPASKPMHSRSSERSHRVHRIQCRRKKTPTSRSWTNNPRTNLRIANPPSQDSRRSNAYRASFTCIHTLLVVSYIASPPSSLYYRVRDSFHVFYVSSSERVGSLRLEA